MMTKILILALILMDGHVLANADATELLKPVESNEKFETYGAPFVDWPKSTTLSSMLDAPDSFLGKQLSVTAEVDQVCQKKGCFFIAQQGNRSIRVAFKDYGFFVPMDIGGRRVTLIGELEERNINKAQAEHLSKDLGERSSVKPGVQYQIIASSVRVFKPSTSNQ